MKHRSLLFSFFIVSALYGANDGTLDPSFAANNSTNNTGLPGILAVPISPFLDIGVSVDIVHNLATPNYIIGATAVTDLYGNIDGRRFALANIDDTGALVAGFGGVSIFGPEKNFIQPPDGVTIDSGFQTAFGYTQYSDEMTKAIDICNNGDDQIIAVGASFVDTEAKGLNQAAIGNWETSNGVINTSFGGYECKTTNGVYACISDPNGTGDAFGRNLVYAPSHPQLSDWFNAVAGQFVSSTVTTTQVVVGSSQVDSAGFAGDAFVTRFVANADGSGQDGVLDFSFGPNGNGFVFKPRDTAGYTSNLNSKTCALRFEEYNAVAVYPTGVTVDGVNVGNYIVAVGDSVEYNSSFNINDAYGIVSRFTPNGILDTSFGDLVPGSAVLRTGTKKILGISGAQYPQKQILLRAVALDVDNGDIYVGGDIADRLSGYPGTDAVSGDPLVVAPSRDWLFAKLSGANGDLDTTFGSNQPSGLGSGGIQILDMAGADDALFDLKLLYDSGSGTSTFVVGAGQASDGNTLEDMNLGLMRIFADTAVLNSIANGGVTAFGDLGSGFSGNGKVMLESRGTATTVDYRSLFRSLVIDCGENYPNDTPRIVAVGQSATGPVVQGFENSDRTPTDVVIARFINSNSDTLPNSTCDSCGA